MFGKIFAHLGTIAGKYFGSGILSSIGRYAGGYFGDLLEEKLLEDSITTQKFTNIRDSFHCTTAKYGETIPLLWGKGCVAGKIIWANSITEKYQYSNAAHYLASEYLTVNQENIALEYHLSFAMALCEGPITAIGSVLHNGETIDLNRYKFRLYHGTKDQMPDPANAKILSTTCAGLSRPCLYCI
jgi:hypothetical protein